jgi:hypothetical protein
MKRLFFLFLPLLLFTKDVSAQPGIVNYQSFAIDNKEVVWVQVYHYDEPMAGQSAKLFEHLKRKAWITGIRYEGTDIIADLVKYRPDYKRYGGKFMNTSTIIRTGRWAGKVRIGFKEGKYRVILYGLTYEARHPASGSGKATIEQHDVYGTLSEFVLNDLRTAFRKNRLKNLDILHFSFKDSFTLMADQVIDSDWE